MGIVNPRPRRGRIDYYLHRWPGLDGNTAGGSRCESILLCSCETSPSTISHQMAQLYTGRVESTRLLTISMPTIPMSLDLYGVLVDFNYQVKTIILATTSPSNPLLNIFPKSEPIRLKIVELWLKTCLSGYAVMGGFPRTYMFWKRHCDG